MSKAALAIEAMIQEKEKQLHDHIRNNKEVMTTFAKLRGELEQLKQTRFNIAHNRIQNVIVKDTSQIVILNRQQRENFQE